MKHALVPLRQSFVFCGRFLPVVFGLGLLAAIGRATQEGAAGTITPGTRLGLGIAVEAARVVLALYALGAGSVARGGHTLTRMLRLRAGIFPLVRGSLRTHWRALLLNLGTFAVIAAVVNVVIFAVARNWSALAMLQHCGWIADRAGPWVTILFLKNVSLIPWTLVFFASLTAWLMATRPTTPARPAHAR